MLFNEGLTGKIFSKIDKILSYFTYNWAREVVLRRGLALEDVMLFECRELRRDPYFEHIARQSLHPY